MEEGRFSATTIATPGIYPETSINGSTVLVKWLTNFIHEGSCLELYNPETGECQIIDNFGEGANAIVTPLYYVYEENGIVKIRSRSDNTEREVKIEVPQLKSPPWYKRAYYQRHILKHAFEFNYVFGFLTPIIVVVAYFGHIFYSGPVSQQFWRPNNDSSSEKILLVTLNEYHPNVYSVLDLETGVVKEVKSTKRGRIKHSMQPQDFQLNGSLVGFKEHNEDDCITASLKIVDSDTGTELYSKPLPTYEYKEDDINRHRFHLLKDKVGLVEIDHARLNWYMDDFSGNTLGNGAIKFAEHLYDYKPTDDRSFVKVYENFLAVKRGGVLHFVDVTSGNLLTTIDPDYRIKQVHGFGHGKFIMLGYDHLDVVDFESPVLSKKDTVIVDAVIINNDGTLTTKKGTVGDFQTGWQDRSNGAFNTFKDAFELRPADAERIVAMYEDRKTLDIQLPKCRWHNFCSSRCISNSEVKIDIPVLLYKEKMINGQWQPVDLSATEVEGIMNAAKLAFANTNKN